MHWGWRSNWICLVKIYICIHLCYCQTFQYVAVVRWILSDINSSDSNDTHLHQPSDKGSVFCKSRLENSKLTDLFRTSRQRQKLKNVAEVKATKTWLLVPADKSSMWTLFFTLGVCEAKATKCTWKSTGNFNCDGHPLFDAKCAQTIERAPHAHTHKNNFQCGKHLVVYHFHRSTTIFVATLSHDVHTWEPQQPHWSIPRDTAGACLPLLLLFPWRRGADGDRARALRQEPEVGGARRRRAAPQGGADRRLQEGARPDARAGQIQRAVFRSLLRPPESAKSGKLSFVCFKSQLKPRLAFCSPGHIIPQARNLAWQDFGKWSWVTRYLRGSIREERQSCLQVDLGGCGVWVLLTST